MKPVIIIAIAFVLFIPPTVFAETFEEKQQRLSLECGIYYDSKFILKNDGTGCYFLFEDFGELSFFSTEETCDIFHLHLISYTSVPK